MSTGKAASCCMRTFSTSAGLPAIPPRKPEVLAMAIKEGREGEERAVVKVSLSSE